ncbi:MAG: PAS domain S-box protein, partial [Leptospiraceae bacterium]|nr:PAS domain S-box protein [Leptospiraceae bacterium]
QELQQKIFSFFQYSLSSGGYLFLGNSESIANNSGYEVVDSKYKIFKAVRNWTPSKLTSNLILSSKLEEKEIYSKKKKENLNIELESIYEKAVNLFAPPGIILDKKDNVVHFFKNIQDYVSLPEGKPSFKVFDILNPDLYPVFSNLIYKIRQEKKEVIFKKVQFKFNGGTKLLDITGRLIPRLKEEYIIITIDEFQIIQGPARENELVFENYDEHLLEKIKELEETIQFKNENLQTTIEELETSNEELQSTNEELISSNEELQSTNEELQSVNEELYTVNSQYQEKIDELIALHNDINNLLKNTKFGSIFLDSNLIIRKFTSEVTKVFNILDLDISRPFSHITCKFNYPDFFKEVEGVLDDLKQKEIEIPIDNSWYHIKIFPYRHEDNSIHGVTITVIDITKLKKSELKNLQLVEVVENSVNGIMITDISGRIDYVNQSFTDITGYSYEEVIGRKPNILKSGFHEIDFYKNLWSTVLEGKTWSYEMRNRKKDGSLYWEKNTISPIKDQNGKIINFFSIKHDITESKRLKFDLNMNVNILKKIQSLSQTGNWIFNLMDNTFYWSDETYRLFGFEPKSFIPTVENFLSIIHIEDREMVKKELNRAIKELRSYKIKYRIIQPDGDIKYIEEIVGLDQIDSNYIIGCIKDITEIQNLYESEKKFNKRLDAYNKQINSLNKELKNTNSILLQNFPSPFMYCKVVQETNGIIKDYEFIDVNSAFASIFGMNKDEIIGSSIRKLNPNPDEKWLEQFRRTSMTGENLEFEQYSSFLKKTFQCKLFSPGVGFFYGILKEK